MQQKGCFKKSIEKTMEDLKIRNGPGPTRMISDLLMKTDIAGAVRGTTDKSEISENSKNSVIITLIYKGKEDDMKREKHRGIRLIKQGKKLF